MFLLIDPSADNTIKLSLFSRKSRENFSQKGKSKDLLIYLEKFLQENDLNKNNIEGIAVVVGEGRFTGTRIATVIANVFGYLQDIKLITVSPKKSKNKNEMLDLFQQAQPNKYISATYSGQPNIN